MTPDQLKLARHALGLDVANRSYRNRYYAPTKSPESEAWDAMVRNDEALRVPEHDFQTANFYCLTRSGAEAALGPRDSLDPKWSPA